MIIDLNWECYCIFFVVLMEGLLFGVVWVFGII